MILLSNEIFFVKFFIYQSSLMNIVQIIRNIFELSSINPQLFILRKNPLLFLILAVLNYIYSNTFFRIKENSDSIEDENIYINPENLLDEYIE